MTLRDSSSIPAHPFVIGGAERAEYARQRRRIDNRVDPRCGVCDEPIEAGAKTKRVDGERCHYTCANEEDSA